MKHSEINMKRILEMLLNASDYVTLELLSNYVGISKRSVQNYLAKTEYWLRENELDSTYIRKKQGYGILLQTNSADRVKLTRILSENRFNLYDECIERRTEIIKNLIFSDDELTIQYLADLLYVSRSVIVTDLEWVEHWLSKYRLQVFKTQRRGIGIVGSEVSRRNAIIGYFDMCKMGEKFHNGDEEIVTRLSDEELQKLRNIYSLREIYNIASIIEEAEKEFDFFLMDDYFSSLLAHIIVSIHRLKNGNEIQKDFLPPDGADFPQLELSTAKYISKKLEEVFEVKLPESEVLYICIHFVGFNAFHIEEKKEDFIPRKIECLALQIIEVVDIQLGGEFSSDKMLFLGLSQHLKSSVYGLEEGFYPEKDPKLIIPENGEGAYSIMTEIYDALRVVVPLYERLCNVTPTKEELKSVMYYFYLSYKRNIRSKKALLVSNYNILAVLEMIYLINSSFTSLEIVDAFSTYQLQHLPNLSFDFIISTVSMESKKIPIADLSHVPKEKYVKCLEDFLFSTFE